MSYDILVCGSCATVIDLDAPYGVPLDDIPAVMHGVDHLGGKAKVLDSVGFADSPCECCHDPYNGERYAVTVKVWPARGWGCEPSSPRFASRRAPTRRVGMCLPWLGTGRDSSGVVAFSGVHLRDRKPRASALWPMSPSPGPAGSKTTKAPGPKAGG